MGMQFGTWYWLSLSPVLLCFGVLDNKWTTIIFYIPAHTCSLIRRKQVLFTLSHLNLIDTTLVFDGKDGLRFRSKASLFSQHRKRYYPIIILIITLITIITSTSIKLWLWPSLISNPQRPLKHLPQLDSVLIRRNQLVIIPLWLQPPNLHYTLVHLQTLQTVELTHMRLELWVVLERLLLLLLVIELSEQDDSTGIVAYSEQLTGGVELDLVDNILLLDLLNRLLRTEYLPLWKL